MKNVLAVLFAFISIGFISWQGTKNVKKLSPAERRESLYSDNPEDPHGAEAYDFYRFRNPQTGIVPNNMRKKELAFGATLPKHDESRSIQWQNRGPYNLGGRTR